MKGEAGVFQEDWTVGRALVVLVYFLTGSTKLGFLVS